MTRALTSGMVAEVTADKLAPILLVELLFSSAASRVWSGIGDLTWNAVTWNGVGDLGSISEIEETSKLRAAGLNLTLSGIPSALISTALTEDYQGRTARIYLGALDPSGAVVIDPYLLFEGQMDVMEIAEGGETATITLSVENSLIALERPNESRYTGEDQKLRFPGDLGLDFVPGLQDKTLAWGS